MLGNCVDNKAKYFQVKKLANFLNALVASCGTDTTHGEMEENVESSPYKKKVLVHEMESYRVLLIGPLVLQDSPCICRSLKDYFKEGNT